MQDLTLGKLHGILFDYQGLPVPTHRATSRDTVTFVSRAGQKLDHGLTHFGINVAGFVCADLGCSTGGFSDCLLQRGAAKVYAVDTGYGVLDWTLRKDPRVVVLERVNAMHVLLPEPIRLVCIDVAWTKQRHILPNASRLLADDGLVITLIKPHYEADASSLRKGILPVEQIAIVLETVKSDMEQSGFSIIQTVESPIKGSKGNTEILSLLQPRRPG